MIGKAYMASIIRAIFRADRMLSRHVEEPLPGHIYLLRCGWTRARRCHYSSATLLQSYI